ncbi:O-methyltransferase [Sciscionella sediminilitoris]|uniref:O-methyltransferase n=1 Tax=Sciscionella sediminilitoris TaxID=1445613 RepID=UPI0004DF1A5F|nr:class I SAM-dependent methyltransferase [Sciscionella sp. SE31]
MTEQGTAAYAGIEGLPPLVGSALGRAREAGFAYCCLPGQGELLRLLAGGIGPGNIGETGTGYGVGLAWLAGGAHPGARLTGVEREPVRAAAAREVFQGTDISVRTGDWRLLRASGPFDLLVLDGGGQGKGEEPPLDPADWMNPGGVLVIDDFTPLTSWPPSHAGRPDTARLYWLEHPRLCATQIPVARDSATILATYTG